MQLAAFVVVLTAALAAASLHLRAILRAARRPKTWLAAAGVALVLLVGLPFIYTHVIIGPPPPPLSFADLQTPGPTNATAPPSSATPAPDAAHPRAIVASKEIARSTTPTTSGFSGTWRIGAGSQAGYSIDDSAMGQTSRVVGRTSKVSGTATVSGSRANTTHVIVDMASVTCHCVHDAKYRQMLEVTKYPTSTFVLTNPVGVSAIPRPGTVVTLPVTGRFTIHGVTRAVRFTLKATQIGKRIAVNGSIPVNLKDYDISSPSGGSFGGLSNCDIDLLLAFDRV